MPSDHIPRHCPVEYYGTVTRRSPELASVLTAYPITTVTSTLAEHEPGWKNNTATYYRHVSRGHATGGHTGIYEGHIIGGTSKPLASSWLRSPFTLFGFIKSSVTVLPLYEYPWGPHSGTPPSHSPHE